MRRIVLLCLALTVTASLSACFGRPSGSHRSNGGGRNGGPGMNGGGPGMGSGPRGY